MVAGREGRRLGRLAACPEEHRSREASATLALYGTEDGLLPPKEARRKAERLPRNARVVFVEGLNHAGFGAYGPQRGDRPATRPREEVLLFLEGLGWDTPPSPRALR